MLGIHDKTVHKRLLRECNLQISKAVDYCRANKASKKQIEEIEGSTPEVRKCQERQKTLLKMGTHS